jgi:hypothetical protein
MIKACVEVRNGLDARKGALAVDALGSALMLARMNFLMSINIGSHELPFD